MACIPDKELINFSSKCQYVILLNYVLKILTLVLSIHSKIDDIHLLRVNCSLVLKANIFTYVHI